MKKILITSTALVVASSAAFADGHTGVSLSGYAEIGVSFVEDRDTNAYLETTGSGDDFLFHSDIDVTFKGKGETDGGIAFGFSFDLDEAPGGGNFANQGSDGAVFISGNFGTVTLGDTDGAFDKAMQDVAMLTSLADDHSTHAGYSGNGGLDEAGKLGGYNEGHILRYDYSFGDFSLHGSYELEAEDDGAEADDDIYGIGFGYDADLGGTALAIGVGYQSDSETDVAGISLGFGVSALDVVLNYSTIDAADGNDGEHMAIGLGYTVDALSIHVNYGEFDWDDAADDASGFGVAVNYDLGGGAVVMFGYGSSDFDATSGIEDYDQWSFGLGLSF